MMVVPKKLAAASLFLAIDFLWSDLFGFAHQDCVQFLLSPDLHTSSKYVPYI